MNEYEMEIREKTENVVEELMDLLNSSLYQKDVKEAFAEKVKKSHRTLQANFMRMIQGFLAEYSTTSTDARNESAVRWASEVTKNCKNFIPYI